MVSLRRRWKSSRKWLRKLADDELMQMVGENDVAAFETVLERHGGVALSLAHRIVGKRALAEDVCQEAFVTLWRNGSRFDRTRGSTRAWVLQIVHHRAIDALRRDSARETRRTSDEDLHERLQAPEQTELQATRHDAAREIRSALEQLPHEQSRVIELAYFEGLTHAEIASMLELPEGTVKGRMRLGLQKLRYYLPDREALL